jgi:hypothetical protein
MGFIDEKNLLLEETGILKVLNDIPDTKKTSSFDSSNDKSRDIIPFLLDFLGIITDDKDEEKEEEPTKQKNVDRGFDFNLPGKGKLLNNKKEKGEEEPKEEEEEEEKERSYVVKLLLKILNKFYPRFILILKDAIINGILKSTCCSSDFAIPPNQNLNMLISQIDFLNNFKNNPQDSASSFLLGEPGKDFDRFIYDTIQTPNVTNTWSGPNGDLIDLTFYGYDATTAQTNSIDFKINSNYNDKSFSKFLLDFMTSIELFSKEKFMATLLDSVFGIISSRNETTKDQLMNEERLNSLMDKMLSIDPCYDEVVYDDSFFTFNDEELSKIEKKSKERKLGIVELDLGCGIYDFDLGDTDGEKIFGLLNDLKNTKNNAALQERKTIQLLKTCNDTAVKKSPKNKESIKNKFSSDLIKDIPKNLVKNSLMKPTVVVITNLSNFITTSTTTMKETSFEFAIFNQTFFEYILRRSWAVLVEILFESLTPEIIKLIKKVVKRKLKKINEKKKNILLSYIEQKINVGEEGTLDPIKQPTPSTS